jgi:CheY-like chemotaxis protein
MIKLMRCRPIVAGITVSIVALAIGIVLSVRDTVNLLGALDAFVWPAIAFWLLWRLLPTISHILTSRAFDVEMPFGKVSFKEVLEQTSRQLDDLRDIVQKNAPGRSEHEPTTHRDPQRRDEGRERPASAGRILWVDDRPTANVFERQSLQDEGWSIEQASTTRQALSIGDRGWNRFDLVISDMGRVEDDGFVTDAGIRLARALHERAPELPMLVYTGTQGRTLRDEAIAAGVLEVTSSPTELLGLIRSTRMDR